MLFVSIFDESSEPVCSVFSHFTEQCRHIVCQMPRFNYDMFIVYRTASCCMLYCDKWCEAFSLLKWLQYFHTHSCNWWKMSHIWWQRQRWWRWPHKNDRRMHFWCSFSTNIIFFFLSLRCVACCHLQPFYLLPSLYTAKTIFFCFVLKKIFMVCTCFVLFFQLIFSWLWR